MTHICVGNLIIMGSDNGLSPGRRQAIIWTNAGILLIGIIGTNCSEISKFKHCHSRNCIWKFRLRNGGHFVSASMCQTNQMNTFLIIHRFTHVGLPNIMVSSCWYCLMITLLAGRENGNIYDIFVYVGFFSQFVFILLKLHAMNH